MNQDLAQQEWFNEEDDSIHYNPEDLNGLSIIDLGDSDITNFRMGIDEDNIDKIQDKEYILELYGKDYFNESTFESFKAFIKDDFNIDIEWDI